MKYLRSSIALRIMDAVGIFSKDMQDIRRELFEIKRNLWASKIDIDSGEAVIVLYSQVGDKKYMITKRQDEQSKLQLWFCFICIDDTDDNYEMNNIFAANISNNDIRFRDISMLEAANILTGFELIRQFTSVWAQYKPTEMDINVMSKFISSLEEEVC